MTLYTYYSKIIEGQRTPYQFKDIYHEIKSARNVLTPGQLSSLIYMLCSKMSEFNLPEWYNRK